MKYQTIYVDPPWPESGGGQIKRGADRHYRLMSIKEISALRVEELANENCHLYLWSTNNYLGAAFKIMSAWGFEYKTLITWGKNRIGLGQYFRGATEHCLFGTRGMLPYKTVEGKRAQGQTIIYAPRKKHSEKPEEMRRMIERVSYGPRIELFARKASLGWDVWGDEAPASMDLNL